MRIGKHINSKKSQTSIFVAFILFQAIIGSIFFLTDKNINFLPHLIFLSLILSSFLQKYYYLFILGITASFFSGSVFSLFITDFVSDEILEWYLRFPIFLIIALVGSLWKYRSDSFFTEQEFFMTHDSIFRIMNRTSLLSQIEDRIKEFQLKSSSKFNLILFEFSNYETILAAIGFEQSVPFIKAAINRLENKMGANHNIFFLRTNLFATICSCSEDKILKISKDFTTESLELDNKKVFFDLITVMISFPDDAASIEELFSSALNSLHHAKSEELIFSKNIQLSFPELEYFSLVGEIPNALAKQQIDFFYQPIQRVDKSDILGFEALIRWLHPEKGMIPPDSYIPRVEQLSLNERITDLSIGLACDRLSTLAKNGIQTKFSINLSARDLQNNNFSENLEHLVHSYGISYNSIIFEITERKIINELSQSIKRLLRLKEYGALIAIDDFGTGYSSMDLIRQLPIDFVKIDKTYIRDIDTDIWKVKMVEALVGFLKKLGIKSIAEGVENNDSIESLGKLGIDYYQGYSLARPMPFSEIESWEINRKKL